jgi:murein L,D-transpeptidase YcbB/YkuD
VSDPEDMDQQTSKRITAALEVVVQQKGKIDDSLTLKMAGPVKDFYTATEFIPAWSHKEQWEPMTDSLIRFIQASERYGLFPKNYQLNNILTVKKTLDGDSIKRMDPALWTRAELALTDGFMQLINDLHRGRIGNDSTFLRKNKTLPKDDFFTLTLKELVAKKNFSQLIASLEPSHKGYIELKKVLPAFLDSMDRRVYTYVTYPFKPNDAKDSLWFIKLLQKRLTETGSLGALSKIPDSTQLTTGIKNYQKQKGMKVDGKLSASLIKSMNNTDLERFKRIAITLDRYKQLPRKMPEKYIWVNLPSYFLQVYDNDTVVLESKIICGKPQTRTPLLYSVISDMVTYPTWTVPNSIIKKQYLPKLKENPYYLENIGLKLMDSKGEIIDPGTVEWSKYTKGIPYKVVQGSGDDNALGVLKFNFSNPYSVYLHDTNERYLFRNASRALSHGCVRVEKWDQLAFYIARNDSMNLKDGQELSYNTDSIKTWLENKEKKRMAVKNGIPLFIAYFSCEVKNGKIRFYDDIYGEDKMMREKFISFK